MQVFGAPEFDDHEQVVFCSDAPAGLRAIIAIHNTNLGPALGGCRIWPYRGEDEALRDVLRLSRAMTYKSAIAELPLGGGKSVIIADPRTDKTEALLLAAGRAVERLGGRYITAEDSGTGVNDLAVMARETRHVTGIHEKATAHGGMRSGDPSPATAYGVFIGLEAAVRHRLGRSDLEGLRVAVQGAGNVGFRVARHLAGAGARLWVSDIHDDAVERARRELGATPVAPEAILGLDVDVLAPCALGGVIEARTLDAMRAKIIAGAANNQLADEGLGCALMERGILYAPDYVINAGGIIDVFYEYRGNYDRDAVIAHIERMAQTLEQIFERAKAERLPTNVIANRIAEQRFRASAAAHPAG